MIDQATELVVESRKSGDENFKELGSRKSVDQGIRNQRLGNRFRNGGYGLRFTLANRPKGHLFFLSQLVALHY